MLDAARIKKAGLPSLVIVWDTFEKAAQVHARVQGVPDLEIVVIPHLKAHEGEADQRRKAHEVCERILAIVGAPALAAAR